MDAAGRARRSFLLGPAARSARIDDRCLARRDVACQACRDACDARAIAFPPRRGVAVPVLDAARCTGCGDCVGVCPASAIALGGAPA